MTTHPLAIWQRKEANGTAGAQASAAQSNRVRAIARSRGIDPWGESRALFGVTFEVLSVGASRALADWFDGDSFISAIEKEVA